MNYNVVEKFSSIEGEGKRQGELCTFIRLLGCNLRCSYCDTKYSQSIENAAKNKNILAPMTLEEILDWVDKNAKNKNITITGGEPLLQDIKPLVNAMTAKDYEVNIETNGSLLIPKFARPKKVFITLDYKLPNSNEENKMLLENWKYLRACDVLKFVISDFSELEKVKQLINEYAPLSYIYLSPVTEKVNPANITEYMQKHPQTFSKCRLQLQLHKQINIK